MFSQIFYTTDLALLIWDYIQPWQVAKWATEALQMNAPYANMLLAWCKHYDPCLVLPLCAAKKFADLERLANKVLCNAIQNNSDVLLRDPMYLDAVVHFQSMIFNNDTPNDDRFQDRMCFELICHASNHNLIPSRFLFLDMALVRAMLMNDNAILLKRFVANLSNKQRFECLFQELNCCTLQQSSIIYDFPRPLDTAMILYLSHEPKFQVFEPLNALKNYYLPSRRVWMAKQDAKVLFAIGAISHGQDAERYICYLSYQKTFRCAAYFLPSKITYQMWKSLSEVQKMHLIQIKKIKQRWIREQILENIDCGYIDVVWLHALDLKCASVTFQTELFRACCNQRRATFQCLEWVLTHIPSVVYPSEIFRQDLASFVTCRPDLWNLLTIDNKIHVTFATLQGSHFQLWNIVCEQQDWARESLESTLTPKLFHLLMAKDSRYLEMAWQYNVANIRSLYLDIIDVGFKVAQNQCTHESAIMQKSMFANVDFLVSKCDVNQEWTRLLNTLCSIGHVYAVSEILKHVTDIEHFAFTWAAEQNHMLIIHLLCKHHQQHHIKVNPRCFLDVLCVNVVAAKQLLDSKIVDFTTCSEALFIQIRQVANQNYLDMDI